MLSDRKPRLGLVTLGTPQSPRLACMPRITHRWRESGAAIFWRSRSSNHWVLVVRYLLYHKPLTHQGWRNDSACERVLVGVYVCEHVFALLCPVRAHASKGRRPHMRRGAQLTRCAKLPKYLGSCDGRQGPCADTCAQIVTRPHPAWCELATACVRRRSAVLMCNCMCPSLLHFPLSH